MGIDILFDGEAGAAWRLFSQVCSIPRPSKHEDKIRQWLLSTAADHGWATQTDAAGNVVVSVSGRGRLADAPVLALQGHMDMVCEKNSGCRHDFITDPIRPRIDGEWVRADGTTLGADNGVALALALALAAAEMPDRMPLELVFTVDEETGLGGALGLDPGLVSARRLLNLDSEEDGVFVIGCVGGIDLHTDFPCSPVPGPVRGTECRITGLRGGHSGVNIHEGRTNATILAAKILTTYGKTQVLSFTGGSKKNAIPREATFLVVDDCRDELARIAEDHCRAIRDLEPGVRIDVSAVDRASGNDIPWGAVEFIQQFPNGVLEVEEDFPDVIRSSNSIGVVELSDNVLRVLAHGRSSTADGREGIAGRVRKLATKVGGTVKATGAYPGWAPSAASSLLRHGKHVFQDVFGTLPQIQAIHAGLEAGIIGDKIGTDELMAYGPTILNAHSPDECLNIASFNRAYRLLKAIVSTPMEA